jgi:hypothetical protein
MTRWVDFRLDPSRRPSRAAADPGARRRAVRHQPPGAGAGDLCIGCAWHLGFHHRGGRTGGVQRRLPAAGRAVQRPVHRLLGAPDLEGDEGGGGGRQRRPPRRREDTPYQSPIGQPTTMVWADELSAAAIVDGRGARPHGGQGGLADPMVELRAQSGARSFLGGDTVISTGQVALTAAVTGGGDAGALRPRRGAAPAGGGGFGPFVAALDATRRSSARTGSAPRCWWTAGRGPSPASLWLAKAAGQGCANNPAPARPRAHRRGLRVRRASAGAGRGAGGGGAGRAGQGRKAPRTPSIGSGYHRPVWPLTSTRWRGVLRGRRRSS